MRLTQPNRLAALVLATLLVPTSGCAARKKAYTTPQVKEAILKAIRKAKKLRREGRLDKASDVILKEGRRVLKEYPQAVLTRKLVKKLLRMSTRIGNLCLDYGQQLTQEAVSDRMWRLADKYKKRYEKHQEPNRKLRELYSRLPETSVTAKTPAVPAAQPTTDATPSVPAARPGVDIPPAKPGEGDEAPVTP